jgi:hypothetical protein
VAGCSWCQSTEEVRAVRMVPVGEWQWQYWQSCGGSKKQEEKEKKIFFFGYGSGNEQGVGQGVAVVGWQWMQSTEDVRAVRMVPVGEWKWQYWPSCDMLKKNKKNRGKNMKNWVWQWR